MLNLLHYNIKNSQFLPHFLNAALGDLFAHYVDAWKSWYSEFSQGGSIMQQHLGKPVTKQFL
jgi:hypothetical protein